MFNFGNLSRLVISIAIALTGCTPAPAPSDKASLKWKPYELNIESESLRAGKKAFVFVYPELAVESEYVFRELNHSALSRLSNQEPFDAYLLRYSEWNDPRIAHIVDAVGFTKKPFMVLYAPNEKPVLVDPSATR